MSLQRGDVRQTLSNTDLLKKITGYNPKTNYNLGIKKFLNWYKDYINKKIYPCIIGLGYVGFKFFISLKKFEVIGFDTNKDRINNLNNQKKTYCIK